MSTDAAPPSPPVPPTSYVTSARRCPLRGLEIGVMIVNLYERLEAEVNPNATVAVGEWIY